MREKIITLFLATLITSFSVNAKSSGKWGKSCVGNPDFFPIGVWLQNPNLAPEYKALGINCYVHLWKGPTKQQIKTLKKYQMPVICDMNEYARKHLINEKIIIAWMHGDEPDIAQKLSKYWKNDHKKIWKTWPEYKGKRFKEYAPPVPMHEIINNYKKIKKYDKTRPVLLNLSCGVAWKRWIGRGVRTSKQEDYRQYLKGADIASFDIYPVATKHPDIAGDLTRVPLGVDNLRKWSKNQKPVWSCIESTHISNPNAKATPAQIKAEIWMAIIHGAKGIIYFVHEFKPHFNADALLDEDSQTQKAIIKINKEITQLARVINSPEKKGLIQVKIEPAKVPIDISVKNYAGDIYVFAVGMENKTATGTFLVDKMPSGKIEVIGENRTLELKNGSFSDFFKPWGVHLYKISK